MTNTSVYTFPELNTVKLENAEYKSIYKIDNIHPSAFDSIKAVVLFIKEGNFEKANKFMSSVIEYMPTDSMIFWLRIFIENKCTNDEELMNKGFNYNISPSYYNAIKYASSSQKAFYNEFVKKLDELKNGLYKATTSDCCRQMLNTDIMNKKNSLTIQIGKLESELNDLWCKLNAKENEMIIVEKDFLFAVEPYASTIKKAVVKTNEIKDAVYELSEVEDDDFVSYNVQLDALISASNEAKQKYIEYSKNSSLANEYKNLSKERDVINWEIVKKIEEMKNIQLEMRTLISKVDIIDKKHNIGLDMICNYDFSNISSLIGRDNYDNVLNQVGLR